MILRILRARVLPGEEERLRRFVRDEAVAQALQAPGLLSFQPALRETQAGTELIVVSTWNDYGDIGARGSDLNAPLSVPSAASMLIDSRAEHYELVIGEARSMPLREAKLRLTRIPIRRNMEAAYYTAVRRWSDRLLDEAGMVAFSLGRRVVGREDEIVAAQVWQDEAAIREVAGSNVEAPMGQDELAGFWAAEPRIEHFDALTAVEPHPEAPALLVADNERRYVHATPAAAELSGRPLARLLTMRVDDVAREADREGLPERWERFVAAGSMRGPFVFERPDHSEVEVRFSARANTPWPGSHASLLVQGDEDADLDLDRALVDAGLIARYAPA